MKKVALFVLLCGSFALSQTALQPLPQLKDGKQSIWLSESSGDVPGQNLVYSLKEQIRKSSHYYLDETKGTFGQFQVNIITLEAPVEYPNQTRISAVSMATVMHLKGTDIPIGHDLFFTTLEITDSQAQSALASLDAEIEKASRSLLQAFEEAQKAANKATQKEKQ